MQLDRLSGHRARVGQFLEAIGGGFLSVCAPLAVAYVASLLVLQANADVNFSADDSLRLGLLFLLTCLFLAEVFALSVLVSTFTRRSATSLVICLFGWLVLGAGFSSALPTVARRAIDTPPWQDHDARRKAEWRRHSEEMNRWRSQHPAPPRAYVVGLRREGMYHYVHPRGWAWLESHSAFEFDLYQETADRVRQHRWRTHQPLARQQLFVERWSVVSPFTGYRTLAKLLARSTLEDKLQVARYGLRYRREYVESRAGAAGTPTTRSTRPL